LSLIALADLAHEHVGEVVLALTTVPGARRMQRLVKGHALEVEGPGPPQPLMMMMMMMMDYINVRPKADE